VAAAVLRINYNPPDRLPLGQQHDGDPPGRPTQASASWARLGEQLRDLRRANSSDQLPEICPDWQVASAEYEPEAVEGTRPFWFAENATRL
jgi:hypothetical protein